MPKNGTYKKNVSKQVKKDKQQKGGGKSHLIVIKCDDRLLINKELIEFWQKTQKIKDLEHKPRDNDYYIDTFLSKQILDVLKLYSNKYIITYLGHYSTLLDINDPFPNYISSGGQTVDEKSIINTIDITKLNTFAIKKTTQERHSLRDIKNYNNIIFPAKLIFQLTLSVNDDKLTPSVNDDELTSSLINRDINEKITKLIDTKIKTLEEEADQEYESKMKEWRNKQGEIAQKKENNTIAFAKYLINKFKFNKSENEIIGMVRAYFDEMNEIVNKLKSCDESEVHGGKKHSKREVLGKTLIIYKINGDRKEYVKYKGKLITIKDYKALIKQKAKKKSKPKKKKKSSEST